MCELVTFLKNKTKNQWITVGPYQVYLRHAAHSVCGLITHTLDIANIGNQVEASMGKGGFKLLIQLIENLLEHDEHRGKLQAIYVECVQNKRLAKHLPKLGFMKVPESHPDLPSYFKYLTAPMGLAEQNEIDAKHPGWSNRPTIEEQFKELNKMKETDGEQHRSNGALERG